MSNTFEEMSFHTQQAVAEIAAHPERKALANLYSALSAVVGVLFILIVALAPAVIWWAYHAAT